jgi:hypothetical protein
MQPNAQPAKAVASSPKEQPSILGEFLHSSVGKQMSRTATSVIVRSLLGTLMKRLK